MYLNFLDCIEKIEKLDYLISKEKTGSPTELARYLNVSERQIYRLIGLMKNLGAKIKFCNYKRSYKYTNPVKFHIGFIEK
ncbi:MAG: HTH domain-containing protein [Bacteroidales bacterium]|jgi:predicted DNA-binding transcriptional regulator YafY|nr:HTH domain-containing protein [Bacteroidales bacterium]